MKEKIKKFIKTAVLFILNPRLLLCFGIGWMITNGWSYVLMALGTWLGNGWMMGIAGAYLTFLWLPVSPEKLVTVTIAIALLRWLFPNDEKTLGILKQLYDKIKKAFLLEKAERKEKKEKRKEKRRAKKEARQKKNAKQNRTNHKKQRKNKNKIAKTSRRKNKITTHSKRRKG